jgi:hypothetical protein
MQNSNEFFQDLSPYPGWPFEKGLNLVSIGWLNPNLPYSKGGVAKEFTERLEIFCSYPMIMTFGVRPCDFCSKIVKFQLSSGKRITLYGEYYLRIPAVDGQKIYSARDSVLHLVVEHQYCPPQEFIGAVMGAALPGTLEFQQFALLWKEQHVW